MSYLFAEMFWTPTVLVEYNFASGDKDPNDSASQRFNDLFKSPSDKYGDTDVVGFSNIHNLRLGVAVVPATDWYGSIDFHCFRVDERKGARVDVTGATIVPANAGGYVSNDVGKELDFVLGWQGTPALGLEAGYSRFFTGQFIRQGVDGRADVDWGDLQAILDF